MEYEELEFESIGKRHEVFSAPQSSPIKEEVVVKPKVRRLMGEARVLTAKQFQNVATDFVDFCETEFVEVSLSKTNVVTGEALSIKRPKPPLIESFCLFAGITYDQFSRYSEANKRMKTLLKEDAKLFEDVCADIKDYCVSKILEYVMLGWIDEGAGKFYITNNSRYQNSAKYQLSVDIADRPAWLQGVAKKEIGEGK